MIQNLGNPGKSKGNSLTSFTHEDYENILRQLENLSDPQYKVFNESLIPGTSTTYGVRVPELRKLAKIISKTDPEGFLSVSRAESYEEIMLQGMVIAGMKPPRLPVIKNFLPLIDNWAICDSFCSTFKLRSSEDKQLIWGFLRPLFSDSREYHARFALVMFLGYFIEDPYASEGLQYIEALTQEQYYVRMAAAWAVSVCYVKLPELTLPLLQRKTLPPFIQNKSIQKIRESYRVPQKDKDLLVQYKL